VWVDDKRNGGEEKGEGNGGPAVKGRGAVR